VANNCTGLKGSRATIMPIVQGHLPPIAQCAKGDPADEHDDHSHASKHKPVIAYPLPAPCMSTVVVVYDIAGVDVALPGALYCR